MKLPTPPARGSNRAAIAILFSSLVIVMIGFGIAIPLLPFYVTHFNASGSALGLMMSLYSFMQFIFAPLWGRLSDRIGRKPILLLGIAGYAISFLLQALSQNLFQLTAARTLAGILSSATLPTAMAYIADTTSEERRSQGVGLMGAAMGLGMIIGPLVGGLLSRAHPALPEGLTALLQVTRDMETGQLINLSIPFFTSSLLALLALPFIGFLLPESLPRERRGAIRHETGSRASLLVGGLRGPVGFLFVLAFLLAFALSNVEAILALYGNERFSLGPTEVGLLMGGMGILSVILQGGIIGPLTRKVGEPRVIEGGLAVSVAGLLMLALALSKPVLITGALLFASGNVMLQPSVTSLVSKRARGGQGAAMGLNNSYQSLGRATGPSGPASPTTSTTPFPFGPARSSS
jgi:MFS transporter, DHA1 family, multidrug resistance protein